MVFMDTGVDFPAPMPPEVARKKPLRYDTGGAENREYDQAPLGVCVTTDTATAEARSELKNKIVVPDKFMSSAKHSRGTRPLSRQGNEGGWLGRTVLSE